MRSVSKLAKSKKRPFQGQNLYWMGMAFDCFTAN